MKQVLLVLIILISTFNSKADSWEEMSMNQAKRVVMFLKENPFVLDYCDCCANTAELVEVISSKIIVSSFDSSMYNVEVTVKQISSLKTEGEDKIVFSAKKIKGKKTFNISMNYTFVYQKTSKLAVCFFNIIDDYEAKNSCSDDKKVYYPTINKKNNRKYSKWFRKSEL